MNLTPVQELKEKLLHEDQLAPVSTFFFDKLVDDPKFMTLGVATSDPLVESAVKEIAEQIYGPGVEIQGLLLTRLADQHFIHGGFNAGGRWGNVFFFEDAHIGLVTIAERPPSSEVRYARFSPRSARPLGPPSQN